MNIYQKIQAAAKRMGVAYQQDVYTGDAKIFITYNAFAEEGTLFADDRARETITHAYVHLFLPSDKGFFSLKSRLQQELTDEGLSFPKLVNNVIEDNKRHLTFETSDEESEE